MSNEIDIQYVKTANNGGCGECACHCHSDEEDIPPGHLPACKFADNDYVPPDFVDTVMGLTKERERAVEELLDRGPLELQ